jgi:hypothetical protein
LSYAPQNGGATVQRKESIVRAHPFPPMKSVGQFVDRRIRPLATTGEQSNP